jgi:hypothetical protein
VNRLIDLLELDVANGRGQKQGVEATPRVPPGTNSGLQVELQRCGMYENDFSHDRCEQVAVVGTEFCLDHIGVKLCKASGIRYRWQGNSSGWFISIETIPSHPVEIFEYRTKRAQFCCDRCRNLWRDTKQTRERESSIEKLKAGGRSQRYALITNYGNSGDTVVLDKETSRICASVR